MNQRQTGSTLPERVASLETTAAGVVADVAEHEKRLDGQDATMNKIRGALQLMIVLWALVTGAQGLGFVRDLVSRPVSAASVKP